MGPEYYTPSVRYAAEGAVNHEQQPGGQGQGVVSSRQPSLYSTTGYSPGSLRRPPPPPNSAQGYSQQQQNGAGYQSPPLSQYYEQSQQQQYFYPHQPHQYQQAQYGQHQQEYDYVAPLQTHAPHRERPKPIHQGSTSSFESFSSQGQAPVQRAPSLHQGLPLDYRGPQCQGSTSSQSQSQQPQGQRPFRYPVSPPLPAGAAPAPAGAWEYQQYQSPTPTQQSFLPAPASPQQQQQGLRDSTQLASSILSIYGALPTGDSSPDRPPLPSASGGQADYHHNGAGRDDFGGRATGPGRPGYLPTGYQPAVAVGSAGGQGQWESWESPATAPGTTGGARRGSNGSVPGSTTTTPYQTNFSSPQSAYSGGLPTVGESSSHSSPTKATSRPTHSSNASSSSYAPSIASAYSSSAHAVPPQQQGYATYAPTASSSEYEAGAGDYQVLHHAQWYQQQQQYHGYQQQQQQQGTLSNESPVLAGYSTVGGSTSSTTSSPTISLDRRGLGKKPTIMMTPPLTSAEPSASSSRESSPPPAPFYTDGGSVDMLRGVPEKGLDPYYRNNRAAGGSGSQFRPLQRTGSVLSMNSTLGDLPSFTNVALLSHLALYVKESVPREMRTKGAVEHPRSFDGQDVVDTLLTALPPGLQTDRRFALHIARSLQQALWFLEVDWDSAALKDGPGKVYTFMDDRRDTMIGSSGGGGGLLEDLTEVPTGVITLLTPCYSPRCGKLAEDGYAYECYSETCPRRARLQRQPSTQSHMSQASEHPSEKTLVEKEAPDWVTSVQGILDAKAVDKTERDRQIQIYEFIRSEEKYLHDLDYLHTNFEVPLRASNIIEPERLESFLGVVMANLSTIRDHTRKLVTALQEREQEQRPFVQSIGDLVLNWMLDWSSDCVDWYRNGPFGNAMWREEKSRNLSFDRFLNEFQRATPGKHGFDNYLTRITFRVPRYPLQLRAIKANTPLIDPEHAILEQAISVVDATLVEANAISALSESRLKVQQYRDRLVHKTGEHVGSLELDAPERTVAESSAVYRRSEGSGFSDWSESHAVLFDHYLVFTKVAKGYTKDGLNRFVLSRRPVPVELVRLAPHSFSDPAVSRSGGFNIIPGRSNQAVDALGMLFPISFYTLGRESTMVTVYVTTSKLREEWEKAFKKTIAQRDLYLHDTRVVQLKPLADRTFSTTAPAADPTKSNRPTCSIPLGKKLVAAGAADGLYIGLRDDPRSMKRVLYLNDITQCAVLDDFDMLLVVTNKDLIAYSLQSLVSTGKKSESSSKPPQRVSGQHDVLFFKSGRLGDEDPKTRVIYVKKRSVKESIFKALEPIAQGERHRHEGSSRFNPFSSKTDSFRVVKEFFIPSEAYSIQFLKNQVAITCRRGVEIMSLETLKTMSIPEWGNVSDPASSALKKRCDEARALGLFRLNKNEFLICYDSFAIHCDQHGEPLRQRYKDLIEWECKPTQVAYSPPWVYAFSHDMVEIRHSATGRLVQVITGHAISCTYDGSGSSPLLHFAMREGQHYILYELQPIERVGAGHH